MAKTRNPTLVTFGRMVRRFRDAAGLTQKELAHRLGYTNGWVSNVETGQLRPRQDQVTALEEALDAPAGTLMVLYDQLDAESLPGWFREWVEEEQQASVIRTFQLALIPGLLQTEEYARALLPGDDAKVEQRMKRQHILRRDDPPTLYVVLDEAVLYQSRGGPEVMRAQLQHLLDSVGPRLSLQVVLSEANPRSTGAFSIAMVNGDLVGYVETTIRGIVTNSREDVADLEAAWEDIRTHALSQRESLEFVRKVIEEKWAK
jgi:transcriptional regulator with XRE-family HTH domain